MHTVHALNSALSKSFKIHFENITMNLLATFEDSLDSTRNLHLMQKTINGTGYGAIFDVSGSYRYSLWRTWSTNHPQIAFILFNPSTADEQKNDPTIRRCVGFARAWNFGSIEVVNLFAFRATHYEDLFKVDDPIGAENNCFLTQAIECCSAIVLGWGNRGTFLSRDRQVMAFLTGRTNVFCLGMTKSGQPRHPLYVKGNTSPVLLPSTIGGSTYDHS